ncbi:MAG TPA: FAD-binding and (Fe-S)-binding domain-containing protein [Terriglobales bacterium]|jgi:FAD/FMN-containing dehydrogenase/Fe-S oxidoreductase|nr:FAD-binding and (Fe-S)-binding domain-containing protein [Terriglobales bacterium]
MPPTAPPAQLDPTALEAALRRHLRGEIRFDKSTRALYATDGSNYRQVPIGVVIPRDKEDVRATVAICRDHHAPLLPRGAGTALAGQCCNAAVILDFSKYMASILEIDPARRIARVQPGVVLDTLRAAAEKHHLTFAPDPATHDRCTLGGMIGNNSCGVHSIMAGKTDDNIEALEILTYSGHRMHVGATSAEDFNRILAEGGRRAEIYAGLKSLADRYGDQVRRQFPNIPRRVSGYNLNHLLPENGFNVARALVGSEGTCVTILEATCRLVESPPARVLLVIGWPDICICADHVPQIMEHRPIGLEGFDDIMVNAARRKGVNLDALAMIPEGAGWLMVEFGSNDIAEAEAQARHLMEVLDRSATSPNMQLFTDPRLARRIWDVRESSLGVTSHVPGQAVFWEGFEDSAVAPEKLGAYLRDLRALMQAFHYGGSFYGHFGHACVHTRIDFDLESAEGVRKFRQFMEEAADLVVRYGGSLSGEHGDGQSRAELLPKMFGPELMQAFREFKSLWDPDWKMNPGKVIDPYRLDENLRLGADYDPWQPETHFKFPDDHGSLAAATLRCVGVGKCRRDSGGVMCPSYRVTREEEHSTRGRAHLLWEMTNRDVIKDGWQSEEVKESLDLCLSCKGCKSDCPVGVDVATYKAEFLSHYYETNSRPLNELVLSQFELWLSAAAHVPGLINLTTQLPGLSNLAKRAAKIPAQRRIPPLAPETFQRWWEKQATRESEGQRESRRDRRPRLSSRAKLDSARGATMHAEPAENPVLLWADTFTNHFLPATAKAAVEVLEAAGFTVTVPRAHLCCGRPLYDVGMLDRAKRLLLQIMDELLPEIEAATPIVVLEPSCASVFRDELTNLFPKDERAQALSKQVFLLSEFLEQRAKNFPLPKLSRRALIHGHCHHKAIMKMTAEESILHRMGIHYTAPAPGCCGMAGAFGFEKDKYAISKAIGELELLPAVRQAPTDWLIVADGFSCREQIAQETDRHALHLAEILQMALRESTETPEGYPMFDPAPQHYPEDAWARPHQEAIDKSMKHTALAAAGIAAGAALLLTLARRRK